jgi:hypothetical protein
MLAQGNALGTGGLNGAEPCKGAMSLVSSISPFQGFVTARLFPQGVALGSHILPLRG